MTTPNKKKFEEIKNALFSSDTATVIKALNGLDEYPFVELVEPLLVVYAQNQDRTVNERLKEVLANLKISGADSAFITALGAKEWKHCRKDLLHFMWSSNIQPEVGWVLVAEIAAEGSYEEGVEILSLLENTELELQEEELLEAVSLLVTAINERPNDDATPIRKVLLESFRDRLNS
jgi:hypothetical protein